MLSKASSFCLNRSARDQYDAVRLLHNHFPGVEFFFTESEIFERLGEFLWIEDAHDQLFAEGRRHG